MLTHGVDVPHGSQGRAANAFAAQSPGCHLGLASEWIKRPGLDTSMGERVTEVRYVETDLPPVMVGLPIHVVEQGRCMAGQITEVTFSGEVYAEVKPPPNAVLPHRDVRYRFEPGGQGYGTFHRLMECPTLAQMRGWASQSNHITVR